MAKKIKEFKDSFVRLALPVPVGSLSDDIVNLGTGGLRALCLTDRATAATLAAFTAAPGLKDGEASVILQGVAAIADLDISVAATQYQRIYRAADGTYTNVPADIFVGYMTETIAAPGPARVAVASESNAMRTQTLDIADLAAGADIAATVYWAAGRKGAVITAIGIIPKGASAGVDDANTAVIDVTDYAGNSIVSKTYNTATQPPAAGAYGSLGTPSATHGVLTANEAVKIAVTQGAAANLPGLLLQIEYLITQ